MEAGLEHVCRPQNSRAASEAIYEYCVALPQARVVVTVPVILGEETPPPAQATEDIPITTADNPIDTKMDNPVNALRARCFRLDKGNEPRYGGFQTAQAYTIQPDHPPLHTPRNSPSHNACKGPTYYSPGPNFQQYPEQQIGPCIYCDELLHICMFCPDVHNDQDNGIVHHHEWERLPLGPNRRNEGEIYGYHPERRFLAMWDYDREVALHAQQGR
jgi:hypothetical protein